MNLNESIRVLDHGYVKFIASMGTDETVVEAARMSTGRGFEGWDWWDGTAEGNELKSPDDRDSRGDPPDHWKGHRPGEPRDAKLLEFMYRNRHSTPFEMCELHIEVQAPIMVFREWHRHRTQAYSEFSARYSQMPNLHYVPAPERIQKQSASNRQGSAEPVDPQTAHRILSSFQDEQLGIYRNYDALVEDGIAKEVARLNTPVSRYSKMRAKTDLRNWLGFLQLRMAPNAQWEIRQYANAVAQIVKTIWPRTYALFEEHDLRGLHLSRTEASVLYAVLEGRSTTPVVEPEVLKALTKKLEACK